MAGMREPAICRAPVHKVSGAVLFSVNSAGFHADAPPDQHVFPQNGVAVAWLAPHHPMVTLLAGAEVAYGGRLGTRKSRLGDDR